ncbi:hypothetical protein Acsp03_63230 [Actinomadura sp. NBRC 104412]|uniref:OmpA family protein n=1 Tax=Actinomadura sp. NBRC 104412 TaxID=3032203 RepID=UPI0024A46F01|nr:OmpA family protein [Actinomadura sp. NBRC 104412]GLZ08857.1 hypothetical protein Acsp03_63230 [Actinomadura sp. NBRC 104412]
MLASMFASGPPRRLLAPAVSLACLLTAAGCADSGSPQSVDPPISRQGPAQPTARPAGQFTKEGWFGTADGLHARLEIRSVERQSAKTVLSYTVTSLDNATKSIPFTLALLDPIGRKLYRPLGTQPGATPQNIQFAPGTSRDLTAEFPPVPATVQRITVLSLGTAGEYTGIPVTGRGDSPSPTTSSTPAQPTNPLDLYDITEGAVKDVAASGNDVKVNLRADVLFESGSAELTERAKQVLDQAAQEIRAQGDPSRGPITINGHTDSQGSDADNLTLSKERAETVREELEKRLGATYRYTSQGKGETELIAKEGGSDDAQARARNRRVEISYIVRQQAPGATTASGRGTTAAPAAFRTSDGRTVASRYATFGEEKNKRRLDVKPFYRDGAYLVAVFEVVNEGPGTIPPDAVYPHKDYLGGAFTSFSVSVPGSTDVYRAVRVGPPAANSATYVDPGRATFRTAANEPIRGFVYIPAPPGDPSTVVFDAGPFGKVDNVPVS